MISRPETSQTPEQEVKRASSVIPSPTWVFWGWLGALGASLALWALLVVAVVN